MQWSHEWDTKKAKKNINKHGFDFEEASSVFDDPFALTLDDHFHSQAEERFFDIGRSIKGDVLVVVYTQRGETTRIISCRKATPAERKAYEEQRA